MKFCPQCRESYSDDSLNYCLNDGTPLEVGGASHSDQQTAVLNAATIADRPTLPNNPQLTGHEPGNHVDYAAIQPVRKGSKAWIWVLGILGLVVLLCGGGFAGLVYIGSQSAPKANSKTTPTPTGTSPTPLVSLDDDTPSPTPTKSGTDLTMAQYERITVGMSRADVEKMLGGKGTEISSTSGGGMNFSVNQWEGANYKSIILSFRDDKVFSKSQAGLK